MTAPGPVEVWRGGVNTWECDWMGHMNVRFYVAKAMEGLVGASAALGVTGAFSARAAATLAVREHHIRFLREAQPNTGLHMTAGLVEMDETEAVLVQSLIHSAGGETAATFLTRVTHTTPDGRPFPWPARAREAAERLRVELTSDAGPRSIDGGPRAWAASGKAADALGLRCSGRGAVGSQDCDVFGRMRHEGFLGRISDAMGGFMGPMRKAMAEAFPDRRIGGAALEYRLVYLASPRAGDGLELRSGMSALDTKLQRSHHWLLDPATGEAWATAEAVSVNLDLETRKLCPTPPEVLELLAPTVTPGMSM